MALEALRQVPEQARRYTVPEEEVVVRGLSALVLAELRALGLRSQQRDGVRYYDSDDVMSLTVHGNVGPSAAGPRRFWPRRLNARTDAPFARFEVEYRMLCPRPGHAAPCRFHVLVAGGGVETIETRESVVRHRVPVSLRNEWPEIPRPYPAALRDMTQNHLMWLPEAIRHSMEFVARTGLLDCGEAARMLVATGEREGLRIRPSFGLVVTAPFAMRHYWADVLVGDDWVPVDPLLLSAMLRWRALSEADWTPYRSPGRILHRLGDSDRPLVTHGENREDEEVAVTLITRPVPGP
ncbi:hypothetical protein GCM10010199_56880 [Dactylosporangium roseum]